MLPVRSKQTICLEELIPVQAPDVLIAYPNSDSGEVFEGEVNIEKRDEEVVPEMQTTIESMHATNEKIAGKMNSIDDRLYQGERSPEFDNSGLHEIVAKVQDHVSEPPQDQEHAHRQDPSPRTTMYDTRIQFLRESEQQLTVKLKLITATFWGLVQDVSRGEVSHSDKLDGALALMVNTVWNAWWCRVKVRFLIRKYLFLTFVQDHVRQGSLLCVTGIIACLLWTMIHLLGFQIEKSNADSLCPILP